MFMDLQFYIACGQVQVTGGGEGTPGPLVSIPGVYSGEVSGFRSSMTQCTRMVNIQHLGTWHPHRYQLAYPSDVHSAGSGENLLFLVLFVIAITYRSYRKCGQDEAIYASS